MLAATSRRTAGAAVTLSAFIALGSAIPAAATESPEILEETYTFVTARGTDDKPGDSPDGMAYRYPQLLIDTDPQSWLRANGQCGAEYAFETDAFSANQVTFQTDIIRGTREQIDAIIADGLLDKGEDNGETGGAKTITWKVETPEYDPCTPIEEIYTFVAPRHKDDIAGNYPTSRAFNYPQVLIDGSIDEWMKKNAQCGVEYTFQTDTMRGTPAQIDAIIADGILDNGEDKGITKYWTVVTPDAIACEVGPEEPAEPEEPAVEEPVTEPGDGEGTENEAPSEPVEPTEPSEPSEPTTPTEPTKPVKDHKHGHHDKHSKYDKHGKFSKYDKHSKHGKTVKYGNHGSYDKHSKHGKTVKHGSYGKTIKHVTPVKSVKHSMPAKTVKITIPAKQVKPVSFVKSYKGTFACMW